MYKLELSDQVLKPWCRSQHVWTAQSVEYDDCISQSDALKSINDNRNDDQECECPDKILLEQLIVTIIILVNQQQIYDINALYFITYSQIASIIIEKFISSYHSKQNAGERSNIVCPFVFAL